jgi:hypothetical protein
MDDASFKPLEIFRVLLHNARRRAETQKGRRTNDGAGAESVDAGRPLAGRRK